MIDVDIVFSAHFTRRLVEDKVFAASLVARAEAGDLLIPPAMEAKRCERQARPQEPVCAVGNGRLSNAHRLSQGCPRGIAEGLAAAHGDKDRVHEMFINGSLDTFRK
jgi:hypothetical protein